MRLLRSISMPVAALAFATLLALGAAQAQTKITVGKIDRRQRLPHPELRRDGPGLLQG